MKMRRFLFIVAVFSVFFVLFGCASFMKNDIKQFTALKLGSEPDRITNEKTVGLYFEYDAEYDAGKKVYHCRQSLIYPADVKCSKAKPLKK